MVGKSGNVGGPTTPPVLNDPNAPAQAKTKAAEPKANDSFVRGPNATSSPVQNQGSAFAREASGASNLFQLARANPEAAKQMVQSLAQQAGATLTELEAARVAAQAVLEKLAKERFQKDALKKMSAELRKQRDKIASLKLRHQMSSRKIALLRQIAGKLGDPRLDAEIDKLLSQYKKHRTDWGRRYNALAMGQSLFGDLPDTPDHLHDVVKANVHPGGRAQELGEAFEELSPRRAIAELIARSIDGTTRVVQREGQDPASRGEYGTSLQNYAFLSEALDDSLERDPLPGSDKKKP
ncbi:MAG: hypothetical protein AAF658_14615 [Myxococcota bacterium]